MKMKKIKLYEEFSEEEFDSMMGDMKSLGFKNNKLFIIEFRLDLYVSEYIDDDYNHYDSEKEVKYFILPFVEDPAYPDRPLIWANAAMESILQDQFPVPGPYDDYESDTDWQSTEMENKWNSKEKAHSLDFIKKDVVENSDEKQRELSPEEGDYPSGEMSCKVIGIEIFDAVNSELSYESNEEDGVYYVDSDIVEVCGELLIKSGAPILKVNEETKKFEKEKGEEIQKFKERIEKEIADFKKSLAPEKNKAIEKIKSSFPNVKINL